MHGTGLRYHGTLRDGILRDEKSTLFHGTGLRYHGILRYEKSTVLHGTGMRYHGIARDGIFVRYTASTVCRMTLHDCTFSTVSYANITARHGMDELYSFIEWGAKKTKSHAYNVFHLASSSHLRAAALTTVVLLIKQKTTTPPPLVDNVRVYLVNTQRLASYSTCLVVPNKSNHRKLGDVVVVEVINKRSQKKPA